MFVFCSFVLHVLSLNMLVLFIRSTLGIYFFSPPFSEEVLIIMER